jgi:hypothetical protein
VVKKLLVVALLLLVSACGIKPTPAVSAGPAPTLRNPASSGTGTDVVLYFVVDGRVAPVARPAGDPVGVETALSTLLKGPTYAEAADGYVTMLPSRAGSIIVSPGPPAMITLPFPLRPITGTGINQLVCTAFAAWATEGRYPIDGTIGLAGTDVQYPYQTCQA